jgi:hypothetical protein
MKYYKQKRRGGKLVALHRVLWEEAHGPIPEGNQIDHINGDIHDNSLSNLRLVTHKGNGHNQRRPSDNTSGVSGVGFHKGRWRAYVRSKHLGYFDDWFDAVCARMSANNKHGFHENHGRIV